LKGVLFEVGLVFFGGGGNGSCSIRLPDRGFPCLFRVQSISQAANLNLAQLQGIAPPDSDVQHTSLIMSNTHALTLNETLTVLRMWEYRGIVLYASTVTHSYSDLN